MYLIVPSFYKTVLFSLETLLFHTFLFLLALAYSIIFSLCYSQIKVFISDLDLGIGSMSFSYLILSSVSKGSCFPCLNANNFQFIFYIKAFSKLEYIHSDLFLSCSLEYLVHFQITYQINHHISQITWCPCKIIYISRNVCIFCELESFWPTASLRKCVLPVFSMPWVFPFVELLKLDTWC